MGPELRVETAKPISLLWSKIYSLLNDDGRINVEFWLGLDLTGNDKKLRFWFALCGSKTSKAVETKLDSKENDL